MRGKTFLFLFIFLISCSSDELIKSEKNDFFNIYKNAILKKEPPLSKKKPTSQKGHNKKWLSRFKQPIILISSEDKKTQATLVLLGNNNEKLTWVSADGISLSFYNGVLISSRGFAQDLIALNHPFIKKPFKKLGKEYKKTYRYINGENDYDDIKFTCRMRKKSNLSMTILDSKILVDKATENCKSIEYSFSNYYYLLSNTEIVIKSNQWINPSNKSFETLNYFAFQKF